MKFSSVVWAETLRHLTKITALRAWARSRVAGDIWLQPICYRPSVISVTVTKGGHPRGSGLYGTSGTMGRGVSRVT